MKDYITITSDGTVNIWDRYSKEVRILVVHSGFSAEVKNLEAS